MSTKLRILTAALTLSAAGFIGIVSHEDYTSEAIIPTKNDRPTLGFGSTFHENGQPVKMGETTTPVRALVKASAHIAKEEAVFRESLEGVSLYPGEYDLYFDWVYQYGTGAWISSSMRRELKVGNYSAACNALLEYRFLTSARPTPGWAPFKFDEAGRPTRWRFDCSTPGNKVCRGVWTRQQQRHANCMAMQ
jgi:lysozyme